MICFIVTFNYCIADCNDIIVRRTRFDFVNLTLKPFECISGYATTDGPHLFSERPKTRRYPCVALHIRPDVIPTRGTQRPHVCARQVSAIAG